MKLLIYSHAFAPSVGGVETIVLALARGLAQVGNQNGQAQFEVVVATQTAADGFDDTALPFRVVRQARLRHLWPLVRAADVVHVAGPALLPILLARIARKPVAVEHHGFQTICPNGQFFIEFSSTPCPGHFMAGHHLMCLRCNAGQGWLASTRLWLLTFVRRFRCTGVSANITPTAWLGTLLRLPGTTYIPHGIARSALVRRSPENNNPPVIAFQGRLVTTKGVRVLLQAARILASQNRTFELVIIGDGPERASLHRFIRGTPLNDRVRFAGQLPVDQLELALSRAAIVVVPSLGGEVFGLVAAENMLRGLPVVASDLGALAEVLGDAGRTFRTGNAADLAARLASLLDDQELAARLGQQAQLRAMQLCDPERMIEAHANLYREIVRKKPEG
jgi:glycosyltransferase involved in cell wall biosynthesis